MIADLVAGFYDRLWNDCDDVAVEQVLAADLQRDPFARDVIAELLTHARRDAVGRELRGMAYRAGLPV